MRSCSSSMLMEEPAEQVASMNAVVLILADELHRGGQVRWSQCQRPMRPMPVVVVNVDPEHSREMLWGAETWIRAVSSVP
jgi:hypothetical protein